MKKLLLILALIPLFAMGQKPYKVYCQIVGSETLSGEVKILIDFGQDRFDNNKLVDEKGEDVKFNSMMDAVNYISKRGWDFEQTYAFSVGGNGVYHYMFSKQVTDDSQIKDGILIKEDFKKKKK